MAIDILDTVQDAPLELVFEVTRMGRGTERANFEKKPSMRLSHEPCLGVKGELEASRWSWFLSEMWADGMIIEDQLDRGDGRISGVEKLEDVDGLSAAVAVSLKSARTVPINRSSSANRPRK